MSKLNEVVEGYIFRTESLIEGANESQLNPDGTFIQLRLLATKRKA